MAQRPGKPQRALVRGRQGTWGECAVRMIYGDGGFAVHRHPGTGRQLSETQKPAELPEVRSEARFRDRRRFSLFIEQGHPGAPVAARRHQRKTGSPGQS